MGFNDYMNYQPSYQTRYQSRYEPAASIGVSAPPQGLIRVTGLDGAKAFQMPPNSVTALFDGDNDIFYVKSTDGAGFPTIKAFAFTPLEPAAAVQTDYVTRQEFEELKGMILNGKQPVRKGKTAAASAEAEE